MCVVNLVVFVGLFFGHHVVVANEPVETVVVYASVFHERAVGERRGGIEDGLGRPHDFVIVGHSRILVWMKQRFATKLEYSGLLA